uniref:Candidate secreted effector n=1 Tax=Meloidogyne incognita TaxID=6306 RepID=A0A914L3C3_MELIC
MSEGSSNSDFDFVQIVDNNDFDIQTKLNNLLIEFNEEKEKNAKLEEKNNFLEKQMDEMSVFFEKKIGKLTNKLEQLSKSCKRAHQIKIISVWQNHLSEI